ncbi:MAG: DUF4129 domain-containing protein [Phycicoccus sp.]|nr:DUF4129 domain-containing protein [Phycicoccus sp.]
MGGADPVIHAEPGPPLTPSSPEAQRWLQEELDKAIYQNEPSLSERISQWLRELLQGTDGGFTGPSWLFPVVVAVLVVVVVAILLLVVRRDRRARASRSGVVLDEVGLSAADLARRARSHADRGDWNAALLDAFRALVARSAERTLLGEAPSLTAHEAAAQLTPVFPADADRLARAARAFDDVRYGGRSAGQSAALEMIAFQAELDKAVPVLPDLAGTTR